MAVFIIMLSCLALPGVLGADPANTPAGVGDGEVTLGCAYGATAGRTWSKGGTTLATDNNLEDGFDAAKYEVTSSDPDYNLKIKNIVIADGDKYDCSDGTNTKSARLVSFAKPNCELVDEGTDKIKFTCSVGYGGDWPPLATMKGNADAVIGSGPAGTQADSTTTRDEDITVTATNDGHVFKCELVLHQSNRPDKTESDVDQTDPGTDVDKYKCTVTANKPTSVNISPTGATFSEGDTLTCTAAGTPTPQIRWSEGANDLPSTSGVLTLTTDMAGKTLTCTASNNIDSATATRAVTTVEPTTAGPTTVPINNGDNTVTQTDTETSSQNSAISPRFHGLGMAVAFMSAILL